MNILTIDVGGSHVKFQLSSEDARHGVFDSDATLTARQMVDGVKVATEGWPFDCVSIGVPAPIVHGKLIHEPHNLGSGWTGFDFEKAFGKPIKLINDAAMQALGDYEGGRMLFLGLGTGLGSAMIVDGVLQPMELAHLPYKQGNTFEDIIGARGLKRLGKKKWRNEVNDAIAKLSEALEADNVVLGGGNARLIEAPPANTRICANSNAFLGGFRLWDQIENESLPRSELSTASSQRRVGRSASQQITTLFLDIGGVLLTNGWDRKARKRAAKQFHLDYEQLNERHHLTFDTYEVGKLSLQAYLDRIVFYEPREFTATDFREFMFAQSQVLPDMLELMLEVKQRHGLVVAAVSNEGRELTEHRIFKFDLGRLFDFFVSSCFVHFRKPDVDIYRLAIDTAQAPPDKICYVDDRPMFVDVATSLGIRGIHHHSVEQTKRELEKLNLNL